MYLHCLFVLHWHRVEVQESVAMQILLYSSGYQVLLTVTKNVTESTFSDRSWPAPVAVWVAVHYVTSCLHIHSSPSVLLTHPYITIQTDKTRKKNTILILAVIILSIARTHTHTHTHTHTNANSQSSLLHCWQSTTIFIKVTAIYLSSYPLWLPQYLSCHCSSYTMVIKIKSCRALSLWTQHSDFVYAPPGDWTLHVYYSIIQSRM